MKIGVEESGLKFPATMILTPVMCRFFRVETFLNEVANDDRKSLVFLQGILGVAGFSVSLGLLICTMISENQGLEKSSVPLRVGFQ